MFMKWLEKFEKFLLGVFVLMGLIILILNIYVAIKFR